MRRVLRAPGRVMFYRYGFGFVWTPGLIGVAAFGHTFNHRRS